MFDPAKLVEDIVSGVGPIVHRARADVDAEISAVKTAASQDVARLVDAARADGEAAKADAAKLLEAGKADAAKLVEDAKAAMKYALTKLRGDVGAAAEVARADIMSAVTNADPALKTAVEAALRGSFNRILELLATSVL